jgi:hypothetical protein
MVLGLGVLSGAAPSYAVTGGGNGSAASPAFSSDGVVRLGLGAQAPADSYSAYYPSNPSSAPVESNLRDYNSRTQTGHNF